MEPTTWAEYLIFSTFMIPLIIALYINNEKKNKDNDN